VYLAGYQTFNEVATRSPAWSKTCTTPNAFAARFNDCFSRAPLHETHVRIGRMPKMNGGLRAGRRPAAPGRDRHFHILADSCQ
jgi:hypothetical protein